MVDVDPRRVDVAGVELAAQGGAAYGIYFKDLSGGVVPGAKLSILHVDTGLLTSIYQVAIQRVKIQRVFAECLCQAAACFHIGFDVKQQFCYGWIAMALADDIKCLQQRHARFHHGGKLAREQRQLHRRELVPKATRSYLPAPDSPLAIRLASGIVSLLQTGHNYGSNWPIPKG